jgi:nitroreductase
MMSPSVDTPETGVLDGLLARRHSCRAFLPTPVERPKIERILAIAQRTASWCNAQPWQVIITSGEGTRAFRSALYAHAETHASAHDFEPPKQYAGAYLQRRRACGLQLYGRLGIGRDDKEAARLQAMENFRLFGAPHAAVITSEADLGTYGAVDCGAYVANFLLAADSLGIAAIAQAALAAHPGLIRRHFGLPETRRVVCGISFGYEDPAHPANGFRTERSPLDEVVTWVDAPAGSR